MSLTLRRRVQLDRQHGQQLGLRLRSLQHVQRFGQRLQQRDLQRGQQLRRRSLR
jgi:hypothetical protein